MGWRLGLWFWMTGFMAVEVGISMGLVGLMKANSGEVLGVQLMVCE